MTTMAPDTEEVETVVLRGGTSVRLAALRVLWDLEAPGFSLAVTEGWLRVSPTARITPSDDAAIRRHRDELLTLVHYCHSDAVQ
jgi:hypothetical protein